MNEIERGNRAKDVLDNEVYQDAFVAIERGLIDEWKKSASPADREELHRKLTLLSKVETYLQVTMQSGKLARMRPTMGERTMDLVRSATGGLR